MKVLYIEEKHNSPKVRLDPSGLLSFDGRCILENPTPFFQEVKAWVKEYMDQPAENTVIDFKLDYVNSSSSKYLTALVRLFNEFFSEGHAGVINWYYESDDESIIELGQYYKSSMQIPIQLIPYKGT